MRTWRFDANADPLPEVAEPGDAEGRRAVFLAAPSDTSRPLAWIAVDDYHEGEGVLLFGAPAGERFHEYVRAPLRAAIEEPTTLASLPGMPTGGAAGPPRRWSSGSSGSRRRHPEPSGDP